MKRYLVKSHVNNNQFGEDFTSEFRSSTKRGAVALARQKAMAGFCSKHDANQSRPIYTLLDCKLAGHASQNGLLD